MVVDRNCSSANFWMLRSFTLSMFFRVYSKSWRSVLLSEGMFLLVVLKKSFDILNPPWGMLKLTPQRHLVMAQAYISHDCSLA